MRIFIDSRFGEGPSNDFRFTLARPLELREGSVGVIAQVLLSHTFETVMEGYNDKLYVAWQDGNRTSIRPSRQLGMPCVDHHTGQLQYFHHGGAPSAGVAGRC